MVRGGAAGRSTGAISLDAVEEQRRQYAGIYGQEAADALIDQEYHCSFEAAILGAYWGKEMRLAEQEGRITRVPVNPDLPVQKAWDIGVDDAMAIWCFQVYPDHLDVVDYYEGHGHGFDHYASWLHVRDYSGTDWVPHDAKSVSRARRGSSRIESMLALGLEAAACPNNDLMDGINAGRLTIPYAHFDEERCAKGIDCLREYSTDWDEKAHAFKLTPKHNWASHGADAGATCRWPGEPPCARPSRCRARSWPR